MSGGAFDYLQFKFEDIADSIQDILDKQGQPREDSFSSWEAIDVYETFSPEVQTKFKEAIKIIKKAFIYAHRIDWFLSGDDSEKNFLKQLEEDLNKLENN